MLLGLYGSSPYSARGNGVYSYDGKEMFAGESTGR